MTNPAEGIFIERIISLTNDLAIEQREYERLYTRWEELGCPCKASIKTKLEKQKNFVSFIEDSLTLNMALRATLPTE